MRNAQTWVFTNSIAGPRWGVFEAQPWEIYKGVCAGAENAEEVCGPPADSSGIVETETRRVIEEPSHKAC